MILGMGIPCSTTYATKFQRKAHFTVFVVFVCVSLAVSDKAATVEPQCELVKVNTAASELAIHEVNNILSSSCIAAATGELVKDKVDIPVAKNRRDEEEEVEDDLGANFRVPVLSFSTHGVKSHPVKDKSIIVGVPTKALFPSFVDVNEEAKLYTGFSIELFQKVMRELGYEHYTFRHFNGSYDDLVDGLHKKVWDAIVGDITITFNRSRKIYFTSAYMSSCLSLIAPAEPNHSNWIFVKPFTKDMWLVTGMVLVYIMFAVWFMERRESPDFSGSWSNQIGTAISFTLASLFFVQKEKLHNLLSRVVIIVWLFTVLIVSSSYTASLSSMLTVQNLRPTISDIRWLQENNKKVGCNPASFLYKYLISLGFKRESLVNITEYHQYKNMLESGSVSAVILEAPYQKAFFNQFSSKNFAPATNHSITFGGLAFGFANRTPLFDNVSRIILEYMENGKMKELEARWFSPAPTYSGDDDDDNGQLGIRNFTVLLALPVVIASFCVLVVFIQRVNKYKRHLKLKKDGSLGHPRTSNGVQEKAKQLVSFVCLGEANSRVEDSSSCDKSMELHHHH